MEEWIASLSMASDWSLDVLSAEAAILVARCVSTHLSLARGAHVHCHECDDEQAILAKAKDADECDNEEDIVEDA